MKPRKRGALDALAFLALCLIVLLHLRRPAPFWHQSIHFLYFVYGKAISIFVAGADCVYRPKVKINPAKHEVLPGLWRRRWDSNPRALADNLISSQARCDHFDTSPCENMQFL